MKSDLKTPISIVNENAKAFTDLNVQIPRIDIDKLTPNLKILPPINQYVSTGQKDQDDKMLNTLTGQALINAKMLESLNKQTSINDEMLDSLNKQASINDEMLNSLKEQSTSNNEMVNILREQATIYKEIRVALVDINTSNKKESKKNTWELILMIATLLSAVIMPLVIEFI